MKLFNIRGFKGCHFKFTNYDNGNIKVEAFNEVGRLLAVLTEDITKTLPEGFLILNDASYTKSFLPHLLNYDLISFYKPTVIQGKKVYICGLIPQRINAYMDFLIQPRQREWHMRYKYSDPILNLKLAYIKKIPVMFTSLRIDRYSIPNGLFCYSIRHDDECLGEPCSVNNDVLVNHYGDIISKKPFKNKFYLSDGDFSLVDDNISLEKYLNMNI